MKVKIPNSETLVLTVNPNETIQQLKEKVNEETKIPINFIKFYLTTNPISSDIYFRQIVGQCDRSKSNPDQFICSHQSMMLNSCQRECVNLFHRPRETLDDRIELKNHHLLLRNELALCFCRSFIVYFETNDQERFYTLEIESTSLIGQVKDKLCRKYNLLRRHMTVSFFDKELQEDRTVSSYNVYHNSVLKVSFPLQQL